jgi:hypothetical protein
VNVFLDRLSSGWQRSETRLILFGAAAILAVYVGFIGLPVKAAEEIVKRGGYYLMFATFALFLQALWRLWKLRSAPAEPLTRRERWLTLAAIIGFTLIAINAEPYYSKILNDEFVLQSTAFNLHYFRDVATMVRGYDIQGVFLSTDNYLDKRPYFYPFLVSLLHDFTGYRIANAYVLNSLLMPVALGLIFVFGRLLAGWRGGMLALLLLGSLPLLGQNATGSGMELLNFVMIVAALVLGTLFLQNPAEPQLAAFVISIVLLAQSRYESALYVLSAALVIAAAWIRARRICLPWQAIIVPLLLVPRALHDKVLSNSPVLWELNENMTSRFSLAYLAGNVRGAISFLFNGNAERANSILLSVLGPLALAWTLWRLVRRGHRLRDAAPARVALVCFSVAILANTAIVLCYYWANFDDPMASRFSLPLYLLLAFVVALMAVEVDRRVPVTTALFLVVGLWGVASAAGKFGHHYYSMLGIDEIEWQRRYVAALPPGDRLILTNRSSVPWLLQKTPAILLDRARLVADRIAYQIHEPTFREILVFQSLKPTTADGGHQIPPEERLPPYFKLEQLAEKRFGTKLSRISRLVDVELPPDWHAPRKEPSATPATPKLPASPSE